MKIFYAVQATGNGHISRAMELLPHLEKYGEVDIFLSGANNSLQLDAPIKYRSKGISLFYNCDGTLSYSKFLKHVQPLHLMKQVRDLPVEKYDLVINDFEAVTALACAKKKVKSVNFGHQASFMSPQTPRPEKENKLGEWILKNYAKASHYLGLHFESYDDFIYSPVIKSEILKAEPTDKGYITVYLPSYCDDVLQKIFDKYRHIQFEIFSHERKRPVTINNITFIPVNKNDFNTSLINCHGIITGGGFETPAEALYLNKKIISIPIKGQYEQHCNGAALKKLGVPVINALTDANFKSLFENWLTELNFPKVKFQHSTEMIIESLMKLN